MVITNSQQLLVPAEGKQKKGPFNSQEWKENSLGTLPLIVVLSVTNRLKKSENFDQLYTNWQFPTRLVVKTFKQCKKYISQFCFKTVRNALTILTHISDILIYCIFFLPGNFLGTLKTFVLFHPMSVILNLEAIKLGIINSRPLGMF